MFKVPAGPPMAFSEAIVSVPPLMYVPPVWLLLPVRSKLPGPIWTTEPLPLTLPA